MSRSKQLKSPTNYVKNQSEASIRKKYIGQGLMMYEKQKNYINKKKNSEKKNFKKKKDRLRYLYKKEVKTELSSSELKEKHMLEFLLDVI